MNDTTTVTPAQLRQVLSTLLDYLWHEERKHFLESPSTERADHIFTTLSVLARWLDRTSESTRD